MFDSIKLIVFDWAGTLVDYGCKAPTAAFETAFRNHGIVLTDEEIRAPMGLKKRDHARMLLFSDGAIEQWRRNHDGKPTEDDLDEIYEESERLILSSIRKYSSYIPGAEELLLLLRRAGAAIGSTTGYTRRMIEEVMKCLQDTGAVPQCCVCSDEVPAGRPAPWMCFRAAEALGTFPLSAGVKIGDTPADMLEGRNAGMWAVGIVRTGSMVGLEKAEVAALDPPDLRERERIASESLKASGAHYLAAGAWDLAPILELIDRRIASGEEPT